MEFLTGPEEADKTIIYGGLQIEGALYAKIGELGEYGWSLNAVVGKALERSGKEMQALFTKALQEVDKELVEAERVGRELMWKQD